MCVSFIYRSDNAAVTNDFIRDRMTDLPYRKLSRQAEIDFIKKAKLSFYYDDKVNADMRDEFLDYYKEMFPKFKEEYDAANDLKKEELLEAAIEDSLVYRNKFLGNNYRLVFKIATFYMHRGKLENLFQEGVIGMIKALKRFDFSKNVRFSTYATFWIRQAITRYIMVNDLLKVPMGKMELINKIGSLQAEELNKTGRTLTTDELADLLEIPEDDVRELMCIQSQRQFVSLNCPVNGGEDNDSELQEFVASNQPDVAGLVENELIREDIMLTIENSNLTSREKEVLYKRFGFYDDRIYTLSELSVELGVARERVRQIQNKALGVLKINPKMIHYSSDMLVKKKTKKKLPNEK